MTDRRMMDCVEMYQILREAITELEEGYFLAITNGTGVLTRLSSLLPEGTAERIRNGIIGDLNAHMIALRNAIRTVLDEDEKEQLGAIGEPVLVPQLDATPKNDYRRHQNSQEDDDVKGDKG